MFTEKEIEKLRNLEERWNKGLLTPFDFATSVREVYEDSGVFYTREAALEAIIHGLLLSARIFAGDGTSPKKPNG